MMRGLLTWATLWLVVIGSVGSEVTEDDGGAGEPVYLTHLIQNGRLQQARDQSRVSSEWTGCDDSYAGYITVDTQYNSNLFFWLFEAAPQKANAPLLLWLNGGPGSPSSVGALLENGPIEIIEDDEGKPQMIRRRKGDWTTEFNMLYVDSPVGTGYSFTDAKEGQPTAMTQIATSLYSLLTQLYTLFPKYYNVDLYIGGQSYAGKYIPVLGKHIHDQNQEASSHTLPLRGIYLGGGLCDPQTMFEEFAHTLYYMGLISGATRREHANNIKAAIKTASDQGFFTLEELSVIAGNGLNVSEEFNYDNMMGVHETLSPLENATAAFMNSSATKRQLHVGDAKEVGWSSFNLTVFLNTTRLDMFVHTRTETAFLMDHYKVLFFSGNLDMTVSVPMVEAFLNKVPWSGLQEYQRHVRNRWWKDDDYMLGWVYQTCNFTRVVVRNAGHQVPFNQPEAALQMMVNFVDDLPFRGDPAKPKE